MEQPKSLSIEIFNSFIAVKLGKFNFRFSSKPITPE